VAKSGTCGTRIAMVDELETPKHVRARFTVGY